MPLFLPRQIVGFPMWQLICENIMCVFADICAMIQEDLSLVFDTNLPDSQFGSNRGVKDIEDSQVFGISDLP